jgi:hypothetical protein
METFLNTIAPRMRNCASKLEREERFQVLYDKLHLASEELKPDLDYVVRLPNGHPDKSAEYLIDCMRNRLDADRQRRNRRQERIAEGQQATISGALPARRRRRHRLELFGAPRHRGEQDPELLWGDTA